MRNVRDLRRALVTLLGWALLAAVGVPVQAGAVGRAAMIAPPKSDAEVEALAAGFHAWLIERFRSAGVTAISRERLLEFGDLTSHDPAELLALAAGLEADYAVVPDLRSSHGQVEVRLRLYVPGSDELLAVTRATAPLVSLGTALDDAAVRMLAHLGIPTRAIAQAPPPQVDELASTSRALHHRDRGRLLHAWREVEGKLTPTAMQLRENIVAQARSSEGSVIERARVLAATGDEHRAWNLISDRVKVEQRKPAPDPDVLLAAAEVQLSRSYLRQARPLFEAVLDARPDDPDAWLGVGQVLALQDQGAEARAALERVAAARPEDPRPLLLLADLEEASSERRAQLLLGAGRRAAERLDPHRARRYFEKAVQAAPAVAGESWRARGDLHQRLGDAAEAVAAYGRAERGGVGDIQMFRSVGTAQRALGDLPGAEAAFRRALTEDRSDVKSLRELGAIYTDTGRAADAVALLERAIEAAPGDPGLRLELGRALRVNGQPERALQALSAASNTAAGLREAGAIYTDLGRLDEAREALERAVRIQPGDADLHAGLAEIHDASGDAAAAERARAMAALLDGSSAAMEAAGQATRASGVASFDELVLRFASQVPDARRRNVVHLGVSFGPDPKARALEFVHPRALDVAGIQEALEASLGRRFSLSRLPGVPSGSLLEDKIEEVRSFDSPSSLDAQIIAATNDALGTYAVFATELRRMPPGLEGDPNCRGPENFEIEVRMLSGSNPDLVDILRTSDCPAGGVGAYGSWNRVAFGLYGLGALLLLFPLMRGWGTVVVTITLPPRTKGFFSIKLSKSADKAPTKARQSGKKRFGDGLRRKLRALSRFERNMAQHETVFRWIPARPRPYTVTLMGPLMDATGEEIIGHFLEERKARVTRGKVAKLEFDLRPNECAVEVQVMLDGRPAQGTRVAIVGDPRSLRYAPEGKVFLYLGLGSYRLLLGAADRVAEYPLEIRSLESAIPVCVDLGDPHGLVFSECPDAVDPYLQSDFESAANALEAAGIEEPAHLVRASFYQQRGDTARAAAEFEAAGRFEEAGALAAESGLDPLASAALFERAGDYARAAEAYKEADDLGSAGRCYEAAYAFDEAQECFEKIGSQQKLLELHERTGAWIEAASLARELGDSDRSIHNLQQISRNESSYGDGCVMVAEILGERGEHELAVEKFEEALRGAGGEHASIELHERHALLLEKAGERERAIQAWGAVRKRDAGRADASTRISTLRRQLSEETPTRVAQTLASGPVESRYEILEELGRGGMGVVYRARDTRLGRFVALKQLPSNLRDHPEAVKLFLREAQAAAALNHRNIVTLFDAGEENGQYFISMELLEGLPLNEILSKRGLIHPRDAARLGIQICTGLAYAQSQRIVHRDIKTANLFFTRDRLVKIMDFGLAKTIEEVRKNSTVIGGTPYYMAPEQAAGEAVDHRADLYALGVTFFQLVTGDLPFRDGDLAYHHRHTPPPNPRELQAEIPDAMTQLILSLMQKSPDDRIQSAAEVGSILQTLLTETESA